MWQSVYSVSVPETWTTSPAWRKRSGTGGFDAVYVSIEFRTVFCMSLQIPESPKIQNRNARGEVPAGGAVVK